MCGNGCLSCGSARNERPVFKTDSEFPDRDCRAPSQLWAYLWPALVTTAIDKQSVCPGHAAIKGAGMLTQL